MKQNQSRRLIWLRNFKRGLLGLVISLALPGCAAEPPAKEASRIAAYVERFNQMEAESVTNFIPDAKAAAWLQQNIPTFECPDREVEELYYFRWWSFRKHLVQTPQGFIITEFLTPVRHADVFNAISCAAGFHLAEGRWLHDQNYLNDYTTFWFRGNNGQPQKKFHGFSSWLPAAAYERYLVNGDKTFLTNLLNNFVADYRVWEKEKLATNGFGAGEMFWQFDVRDGMEESISGSRTNKNLRPTINSYMFANARAIAEIARLANNKDVAGEFAAKAARLKMLTQENLWNDDAKFFEVRHPDGRFANVREELGYVPWMFSLPGDDKKFAAAWSQLTNSQGFAAPFGLATAERRHPQFRSHGVGTCEWDGAVWPFATCQTLYALANVLRDYSQSVVTSRDYFDAFRTYVQSQHADGKPYIGEYLDETTGRWINGKNDRSRYYNHSTFADLLISGVVGLRPQADDKVEVDPLLPAGTWDWFCLDRVKYHGHLLTVLWDKTGEHYHRGQGLTVFADGRKIAHTETLSKLKARLP